MSDLQRRIEYIIEGDDDAESKAEKIVAMIDRRDRHIAKLAEVGMAQEAEIAALKKQMTLMCPVPVFYVDPMQVIEPAYSILGKKFFASRGANEF